MKNKNFLWGSATASYQCEGAWNEDGRGETQWDDFSHNSPLNINSVTGDVSCDFYHRFLEDLDLMKEGNQNTYRFSISWTRIIPSGVGAVNEQGVEYYNKLINACLERGITPNVTLWHYDMPINLERSGGWENRETIDAYVKYAKVCFEKFGDRVPLWATLNEPEYFAYCAYAAGNYPPNVSDFNRYSKVGYNLLLASARAVIEFRKLNCIGKIGLVHASSNVETEKDDEANRIAYRNADLFYNKWITDTCIKGYFPTDLYGKMEASNIDMSFVKEEDKKLFEEGTVDFLGVNIYSRAYVKPFVQEETSISFNNKGASSTTKEGIALKGWFETAYDENARVNKWGREIHPKCMYDELIDLKKNYGDFPIYITENGHGCYEDIEDEQINDDERIEILEEFIYWMKKAINDGVNVQGYYIWSTMDLYSWVNGYAKRYGLVAIDFNNGLKRIPKKSFYWYKQFIQNEKGELK
ncbi:MAG: glycoside hydrolase family 1 protein [Anaerorhabdus sp.]|uniref:glycoside hydrolase family 1 protein n=1 Tax=Anaerorhabdus sp. TaxID=1872524 RepID=UPI002B1FC598|nr:glycoside hydrolase family 1 protein [Anaerorhabdus sp.]MEA4875679.1 glycoside hydrolase family 1 protein [Anaerorhabdus sp.]